MAKDKKESTFSATQIDRLPGGGENIEQIRHLLFGPQVKGLEKKITELDDRLARNMNEMRDDLEARLDTLESFFKSELSSQIDSLDTERFERIEVVKQLTSEVRDDASKQDQRAEQIERALEKNMRELRENILEQVKLLGEEIAKKHQLGSEELQKGMTVLREELVDRSFLSSLFTESALRLSESLMETMLSGEAAADEG